MLDNDQICFKKRISNQIKRYYDDPLEMPFILKTENINTILAQNIHLLKLLNPIFEITTNIKMSSARNILWLNILQIKAKPYIWFKAGIQVFLVFLLFTFL